MKKKYLSLFILPLLVMGICSCDAITIMDSREDINPTDPNQEKEEDLNTYSIEIVDYSNTVEVGKYYPVSVKLITETEEGEKLEEEGTITDILLISSDTSTLTVSKMDIVGVKIGYADLTIRWVSHPSASITIENIEVVTGYTYDISLAYYITAEEDEEDEEDVDEDDDDDDSDDDDDDDNEEEEEEESGPVEATSISIEVGETLSLSDFTIKLGTLADDGIDPIYTQVDFTDENYEGTDIVIFNSSDTDILEVSECGTVVTGLTSGRANLSVTWIDHDVSSSTIRINVTAPVDPDEGDGGGDDGNQGGGDQGGDNPDDGNQDGGGNQQDDSE